MHEIVEQEEVDSYPDIIRRVVVFQGAESALNKQKTIIKERPDLFKNMRRGDGMKEIIFENSISSPTKLQSEKLLSFMT